MHKLNAVLEEDVQEELDWDPAIDDGRIIVKADDGKITLTGSVATYYESTLAMDDTYSVGGVTIVENQLMVGLVGDAIADTAVAADCASAIDRDRLVPKGSVDVTVVDGWATLTGEVRHHYQRRAAEDAMRRVNGILGVTNEIALTSEPIPSDVADRINRAFKRNAIIDDSRIDVTNVDHIIYLDGTVESWRAMDEAVDTAWGAPGVGDVVHRLVIVP
jgi:osmotically-inducible protein OsmY